jgi:hypothetical protein
VDNTSRMHILVQAREHMNSQCKGQQQAHRQQVVMWARARVLVEVRQQRSVHRQTTRAGPEQRSVWAAQGRCSWGHWLLSGPGPDLWTVGGGEGGQMNEQAEAGEEAVCSCQLSAVTITWGSSLVATSSSHNMPGFTEVWCSMRGAVQPLRRPTGLLQR